MTTEQFNQKYNDYLEEGHYGLAINDEQFIEWLDEKFQEYIKLPDFEYSQIKAKFGMGRFYCEGLSNEQIKEVEDKITELCKK
jgi:vacuolar-type H+-ATPase subunit B/Vma2